VEVEVSRSPERPRVVTVGLDASPPPPLHTGHPGEGFEVDLLQAVADRIGVSVRYESALWREIVERLVRHELDMVCSAATITEKRRQLVDFSIPYLDFPLAIVVHVAGPPIQNPADLADRVIGVRVATTAEQFVQEHLPSRAVHSFDFNTEAYAALDARRLDAVIDDYPIARGFERLLPTLRVAATIEGTNSQYGIMFAKGNDGLRGEVDEALRQLSRDGTHAALCHKWLGSGPPPHRANTSLAGG
jgi:ABC-type amino acid transport substrate-binding protein